MQHNQSTDRLRRTTRNTLISIGVLLLLCTVGGLVYVYITDEASNKKPVSASDTTSEAQDFIIKPTAPGPNIPENAAVEAITSPVSAGSNASISIKTNATSTCTIDVSYNGVKATDSGLVAKVADDFGSITWAWSVSRTAAAGTWPVKVTCLYRGRSAVVIGDLAVTQS